MVKQKKYRVYTIVTKIKLQTYNRSQHGISSEKISPSARVIMTQLLDKGYQAYIVGGAVRDLLLNKSPKDFDIATNATPEQIKEIFNKHCRIIGRRFRLAHVYHNREMYEVATFRGTGDKGSKVVKNGHILQDNNYGTIEQDAIRRDFTCNALYFDIENDTILDYCDGVSDLKEKKLKFIGDDAQRIIEDPIRMIRVVRFYAKLGLEILPHTHSAILSQHKTIANVSPARLFDELVKLFHCGNAQIAFNKLNELRIFGFLFPLAKKAFQDNLIHQQFINNALMSTDLRIQNNKSVTPLFLFSCFFWPFMQQKMQALMAKNIPPYEALNKASNISLHASRDFVAIPKIIQIGIRNIWMLQYRFQTTKGKKVFSTLEHQRFRAAYDFLILRKHESQELDELGQWWTTIQTLSKTKQKELIFQKRNNSYEISYLGLGSNQGDSKSIIVKAIKLISHTNGIRLQKIAPYYKSQAWGKTDQPDFINTVIKIKTNLLPQQLLKALLLIEKKLGRIREEKWGPRLIDIDILTLGNKVVNKQHLTIPHPHITERNFVLLPLLDLDNEISIPKFGKLSTFCEKGSFENQISKLD